MRVLITGATGLIGQEIVKQCHQKDIQVFYLTTSKNKIVDKKNYKGFYWNPDSNEIDENCFTAVNTIIHLAGASVAKRWTDEYKKEIISSRTETTQLLIEALKNCGNQTVKHIVSASAIGIYPDSKIAYYDTSDSETSNSFLGQVVDIWEHAVDGFKALGLKVSKIRIGLVLAKNGGALPKIFQPIRLGVGAALGSGEQWQSWIHIEDLAQMFVFVIENALPGIYNGVAPNAVTNKELTHSAAKILNKPLWLPNVPQFMMKLILGEMHIILFESQRVSSKKIETKGFHFNYSYLEPALKDLLA